MIDVGRLNKRITFMKYKEIENELGNSEQKLEKFLQCWASVDPTTGTEYLEAQKTIGKQTFKVFTRYFADIDANTVIDFKGRRFNIISVINYREDNEMLQIVCTEKSGETIE